MLYYCGVGEGVEEVVPRAHLVKGKKVTCVHFTHFELSVRFLCVETTCITGHKENNNIMNIKKV